MTTNALLTVVDNPPFDRGVHSASKVGPAVPLCTPVTEEWVNVTCAMTTIFGVANIFTRDSDSAKVDPDCLVTPILDTTV